MNILDETIDKEEFVYLITRIHNNNGSKNAHITLRSILIQNGHKPDYIESLFSAYEIWRGLHCPKVFYGSSVISGENLHTVNISRTNTPDDLKIRGCNVDDWLFTHEGREYYRFVRYDQYCNIVTPAMMFAKGEF